MAIRYLHCDPPIMYQDWAEKSDSGPTTVSYDHHWI